MPIDIILEVLEQSEGVIVVLSQHFLYLMPGLFAFEQLNALSQQLLQPVEILLF